MESHERDKFLLAVVLTAIAGCVDAVGFLKLGHLFVSFMSGDSTHIAVALGDGVWHEARFPAAILVVYLAGVSAGRQLAHFSTRWHRPLILFVEAWLLLISVISPTRLAAMLPMALAMGMQSAAMHRVGQTKVHLTYVTGTLVNFAEKLTDAVLLGHRAERWQWLPYLLQWIALVLGAALGAITYGTWGMKALGVPAAALVMAAFVASRADFDQIERLGGRT